MIVLRKLPKDKQHNQDFQDALNILGCRVLGKQNQFQNLYKWPLTPAKELLNDLKELAELREPSFVMAPKPVNSRRLGKPAKSACSDLFINQT